MLQYTFSKTKYEAALEKKIQETGAGSQVCVFELFDISSIEDKS